MVQTIALTIVIIHNITDTTKNAMDNKNKNDGKLTAIWEAMPSRPRVMIILGKVTYSTVHAIQVHYRLFRYREKVTSKRRISGRLGLGQGQG